MSSLAKASPTPEEIFKLFPQLAGRVTGLRTILQNPEHITQADANLWVEDVQSTMQDFLLLMDLTRDCVAQHLTMNAQKEIPDAVPPTLS